MENTAKLGLKVSKILAGLLADQYGFRISQIQFVPVEHPTPKNPIGELYEGVAGLTWQADDCKEMEAAA